MTHPTEHRAVTAEQARAEYLAACHEVNKLESVSGFLEQMIMVCLLDDTECVITPDRIEVRLASDTFWLLRDLQALADRRLQDVLAARRYAWNTWQAAEAANGSMVLRRTCQPSPICECMT